MTKWNKLFLVSLLIVAFGQPALWGPLGALSALGGFALFFASQTGSKRFLRAWVWFSSVQLIQLSWMCSIEFQGYYILFVYALLSTALGCQFAFFSLLVPTSGILSLKRILLCAGVWTIMEWSRLFLLCGFSWNPIGLALTHFTYSLQFASVFGIFGLSFWVMLTNLVFLNLWRSRQKSACLRALCFGLVPYLFGIAHLALHAQAIKQDTEKWHFALVQTNLLPSEKMPHAGRYEEFCSPFVQWERILKALQQEKCTWDMIILPEVALPICSEMPMYAWENVYGILKECLGSEVENHFASFEHPFAQRRVLNGKTGFYTSNLFWCQTICNFFNAEMVVGLDHADQKSKKNFNSVFYLSPCSIPIQRYDKQVLLPLAENLPFSFLKSLSKRYGIMDFFTPGSTSTVFGKNILFSPSICYEETFPEVMREGRLKGAQLFVNVTNDNYFPHSNLHRQHLYHARVRAVENGIPLVRACNAGVSALIDSFGRILKENSLSTKDPSILTGELTRYTYQTFYMWWGDLGIISISFALCALFLSKKIFARCSPETA